MPPAKPTLDRVQPVLMCRDVEASVRFYQRLGFTRVFDDGAHPPRYAGVRRDRVELHLQWQDAAQWEAEVDRPTYRFPVADVDALFDEFVERGVASGPVSGDGPWASPADTPWGTREFHVRDPGGNGLQFYAAAADASGGARDA